MMQPFPRYVSGFDFFITFLLLVIACGASNVRFEELMDRFSSSAQEETSNEMDRSNRIRPIFVLRDPSYVVVAPRVVRAGYPYRLVMNVLPPSPSLVVVATLFKDNIQVEAVEKECHREEPQVFQIMVPSSSSASGHYRLRLEGNEVGWLTGSAFTNETDLVFSPRGATVLIQIERKIYNQGDNVRIRIIALDSAIRLIQDTVDVFILSPRGVLVKKWLSRQCREGAISLKFPLSAETELGEWKVRVEATNSFAEETFLVENYGAPLFEVNVGLPLFLSSSEIFLEGSVSATYSSGAPVAGNVSLAVSLKPLDKNSLPYYRTNPINLQKGIKFNGIYNFRYSLTDIQSLLVWPKGLEIRMIATVGDALLDASNTGYGTVRIFKPDIALNFMGESPFIIRPSMPFKYHLTASMMDESYVPKQRLRHHRLVIIPEVRLTSSKVRRLQPRIIKMMHDHYGLWSDELDLANELTPKEIENQVESLTLKAELKDVTGSKSYATLIAIPQYSPGGRHLQLSTSTKDPKVGEFIILHTRSNFYVQKFRYVVMSKGVVITAGQEKMEASLKTFPLALTPDMAGSATVVVYTLERDEDVVADALTFPVDALTKPLTVSLREDLSGGRIRVFVKGEPGSRVSLTGLHSDVFQMQKENELTKIKITKQMMEDSRILIESRLTSTIRSSQDPLIHTWSSDEELSEDVIYLPRGSFGSDANHTFTAVGLKILSDIGIPARRNPCRNSRGLQPCLIEGCYSTSSTCDGKLDCIDRIDEKGCSKMESDVMENLSDFFIHRNSRLSLHFAPSWLWADLILGADGRGSLSVVAPEKPSDLVLSAFALHLTNGMSLMDKPVTIKTCPTYWLWVEAPARAGVWEQVGIRVTLVNQLERDLPAVVVLANNPSYRFISLEDFEMAQCGLSYPRLSMVFPQTFPAGHLARDPVRRMLSGEHEHPLVIPGGRTRTIHLPIVPVVTGEVKIIVQASIPGSKISRSTKIIVEPMGAAQEYHTSLLLDLSSRPYLFTFLDVVGPKHSEVDAFANARISLFGGTVGGGFNDVVSSKNALNLPEIGCEPVIFSILMTVLKLNHWKEMNQRPPKNEKQIFSHISLLYQTLLSYQGSDGGFKYFRMSPRSSVWVTSLVLRALAEASARWQKLLYVDPQVTDRAIRFLIRHQSEKGTFWEPTGEVGVRHLEESSGFTLSRFNTSGLNLSSTALTVLQLMHLKGLPEPLDDQVLTAMTKSLHLLEENLNLVDNASNPLEIALIALVLHLMRSEKAEEAFAILARNARQEVKYVYWGEDLVPLPSYRLESQRPHLQPRRSHRHDSGNVASTACALRVYAARGELLTPAIVRWLHSQRAHDGGWMSTLDTLLAWEALYEFSSKNKIAKYTHLTVSAESLGPKSLSRVFFVTSDNILHLQQLDLGDASGSIRIQGKGNGSAVLQLTSTYYTSNPLYLKRPPQKAFILGTRAVASGKNASTLSFSSCVRWMYTGAADSSGIAVLEVSIPTGYGLPEKRLSDYVKAKKLPTLRKAKVEPRKVSFYFDKLTVSDTCVEFSVHRWFPVANLTKTLVVKVYEYYSPELFAIELLDMSSITLDICQVCGSYQCPNCPVLSYYSSGSGKGSLDCGFFENLMFFVFLSMFYSYNLIVRGRDWCLR